MFGRSKTDDVECFVKVLAALADQPPEGLPKSQINALTQILKRAEGFAGGDIEALRVHLGRKPKKKSAAPRPKKTTVDAQQIEGLRNELAKSEHDQAEFEATVESLNKTLTAPVLKALTSKYVPAARPRTKGDAVRILLAARNDKLRAREKAKQAANATPW